MDEGLKFDKEKERWDLMPWTELESVVSVLTYGANKYAEENWKKVDKAQERYFAAVLRHLTAYRKGEKVDESGLPHLSHAICSLLFMLWFDNQIPTYTYSFKYEYPIFQMPVLEFGKDMSKWIVCGDTNPNL